MSRVGRGQQSYGRTFSVILSCFFLELGYFGHTPLGGWCAKIGRPGQQLLTRDRDTNLFSGLETRVLLILFLILLRRRGFTRARQRRDKDICRCSGSIE
jgi:hypothetical protein